VAAVLNYTNNTITIYKNGAQVLSQVVASGWDAGSASSNTQSSTE
jgi:hypothetical protein